LTLHPNGHETRYYNQLDEGKNGYMNWCGEKINK
jgi:hypothetical protein